MIDKEIAKVVIIAILVNAAIGGIWAYNLSHYMLLTGWVLILLLLKRKQLDKYRNPSKIIAGFIVSCTLIIYVILSGLASLFTILDFAWIDMAYAAHRLKMIYFFSQTRGNFGQAVFAEILFSFGVRYFGSYTYLILDSGIAYPEVYASTFFALNEEQLQRVLNTFCAVLPTLAGLVYIGKFVIISIVGAGSAILNYSGQLYEYAAYNCNFSQVVG